MTEAKRKMQKIITFSVVSLALTALGTVPDTAFAKGGKGAENSSGGGKGKSSGKGGNGASDHGAGGSKKASSSKAYKEKPVKIHSSNGHQNASGKKNAKFGDVHPSELGALNAAHANENALLNASPNSRVGKLAIYRDSVLAGRELEADLSDANDLLAGWGEAPRMSDDVASDIMLKSADLVTAEETLADLVDNGGTPEEILAAETAVDDLKTEIADLGTEYEDSTNYETALADVENIEGQLENQPLLETTALEAAANKPVNGAVETTVQQLLGIYIADDVEIAPVSGE